jgi:ABC-2 type transport system ATP-binding protein
MIRVHNVHKSFGAFQAVRGVSFEVPKGQCVGLLGPNGAGKTTTIRMITGYIPPTSGTVAVGGSDTIRDSMAARQRIGYLPESTPLYPEMRVKDYLLHRARMFAVPRANRAQAVAAAAEQCWLREVLNRRIGHLSKGYKQRVGLASALIHNPPVLVLDEPTSGLDPSQIRETRSLIRDLAANRTVLVSSHILPEVEKTCDRVVIIARGRVKADGHPRRLVEQAAHGPGAAPSMHNVEVFAPIAAQQEQILAMIRTIHGVDAASIGTTDSEGWTRFMVSPRRDTPDLREALLASAMKAGLRVREVQRATPTLEQVFMSLLEQDDLQPAATASPARAEAAA